MVSEKHGHPKNIWRLASKQAGRVCQSKGSKDKTKAGGMGHVVASVVSKVAESRCARGRYKMIFQCLGSGEVTSTWIRSV